MSTLIIAPARAERSYTIAAEVFADMWAKITGETLAVATEDDGSSDLVLIGSDSANGVAARFILDGKLPQPEVVYGGDGYAIISSDLENRQVLHLAGGRGRGTLYAVYDYFERAAGCRYFWDGDIIPTGVRPSLRGMNVHESPRFEYRGLRYFAHRSLHRFQAEHWSLEDWKREIDWMLKKRLNMFMLRIGMDDLFQKAFPDIVDYPSNDAPLPEAGPGYDDRTTFWSLKYRGELRKNLLAYAFDRDLMHPEDCGTMTHWYSRTPIQFLEKVKPSLCVQSTKGYAQETGLVWNVLDDDNLDNYFKLTRAHIENYGRPDIFHTIGFAERRYSDDRAVNLRMKLYIYRRIARFLQENYPNAPLMIASWDLWQQYTPEEVQKLVAELDPNQSIILDYTSDSARGNNFTNWGLVGKFPYIFGIFQGFEPDSDVRGNYDLTEERLKVAADDEFCKGLILWPELSHSDTFMTEFLADNAWSPLKYTLDERIGKYAADRYRTDSAKMAAIWRSFMPIVKTSHWSPDKAFAVRSDLFFNLYWFGSRDANYCGGWREKLVELIPNAVETLTSLAKVDYAADEFIRRDVYDIARTVCGRYINLALLLLHRRYNLWLSGVEFDRESFETIIDVIMRLYEALGDILAGHEDYSMYETLEGLKAVTEVNPVFEATLKNNAGCGYCRSYIYENVKFLYQPEVEAVIAGVRKSLDVNAHTVVDAEYYAKLRTDAGRFYYSVPLSNMRPMKVKPLREVLIAVAEIIAKLG